MLQYSKQHKIINDISLSFSKLEKVHTKISDKILIRDKQFYNTKKYQNFTESNFKFLVLWTVFKNNTNKIDALKLLSSYTQEDLKFVQKQKEKIIVYNNTIEKDFIFMKPKNKNYKTVLDFYKKQDISLLYVYNYFNKNVLPLSRIETKKIERINFFMEFFPSIQKELFKV